MPQTHEDQKEFAKFFRRYAQQVRPEHRPHFEKKALAIANNVKQNWEDEDVAFWDHKYRYATSESLTGLSADHHNPRDIPRKSSLFDFLPKKALAGKMICEVGTGEAATIRYLLHPNEFLYFYIPTDYSYQALLFLKRLLGKNRRVYFIQCLGERLPFQKGMIDYLIVLGVLHHMPKMEEHISELIAFVKPGGWVLLEEPYTRESKLSDFFFEHLKFIFEPETSAHENRPQKKKLMLAIKRAGKTLHIHHLYSPFMTAAMLAYAKIRMLRNDRYVRVAFSLDQLWIRIIGKACPAFSSGQCQVVIERTVPKKRGS